MIRNGWDRAAKREGYHAGRVYLVYSVCYWGFIIPKIRFYFI